MEHKMTLEEYEKRYEALQHNYEAQIAESKHEFNTRSIELGNKWARDNARFSIGDVISSKGCIIKITEIKGYRCLYGDVCVQYRGETLSKRMQPQPKIEWSEEDEAYLDHIVTAVKMYYTDYDGNENPFRESLLDWLKSLRPQNMWKPSDEQINALYDVLNPCDGVDKKTLESLYEQLKALV